MNATEFDALFRDGEPLPHDPFGNFNAADLSTLDSLDASESHDNTTTTTTPADAPAAASVPRTRKRKNREEVDDAAKPSPAPPVKKKEKPMSIGQAIADSTIKKAEEKTAQEKMKIGFKEKELAQAKEMVHSKQAHELSLAQSKAKSEFVLGLVSQGKSPEEIVPLLKLMSYE
jgi:hypothetical protein